MTSLAAVRERASPDLLRRAGLLIVLGALLAGALLLRVPGISNPSVEQRETQSALLARQWALGDGSGLPLAQQRVLEALPQLVRPIEPPILDSIAALHFRLSGENFWFPRLLSSLFWVAGGVFVFLIGLRITSVAGAFVAVALYLTWPFATWLSRHWMPDALLVFSLLVASLLVIRFWEQPTRGRLLAAGGASSLAAVIKPGVGVFFLVALFAALAISRRRLRVSLRGPLPAFAALTVALPAIYYVVGFRLTDFVWSEASRRRITPSVALTGDFWSNWWDAVSSMLRYPQTQSVLAPLVLALAAAGIAAARRPHARAILLGLLAGYVVFALTFAAFVSTNPYYSLPLVPILGLALGALAGTLVEHAGRAARVALVGVLVAVVGVAAYKSYVVVRGADHSQRIADYRRIGELTGHTTWALVVDRELSTPAMYWGWLVGPAWNLIYERPPAWIRPERAEFLIVVGTEPLTSHTGLQDFVRGRPVVEQTERYAVFDLR